MRYWRLMWGREPVQLENGNFTEKGFMVSLFANDTMKTFYIRNQTREQSSRLKWTFQFIFTKKQPNFCHALTLSIDANDNSGINREFRIKL
mgnify:FL=1